MEEELEIGIKPDRLAYCSFTKKAVDEARERVMKKFGYTSKELPYFKNLHALAFYLQNIKRSNVLDFTDYSIIGDHLGIEFTPKFDLESGIYSLGKRGDKYTYLYGLSRAKCMNPKELWDEMSHDNLNWYEYERYEEVLIQYKQDRNLVDFGDMLEQCNQIVPVDVVIIDEAQDLSTLQWKFIERVFCNVKRKYIAGDDDQAIYSWSGADVDYFQNIPGETEVLHQSWRIPSSIHEVANDIAAKIEKRSEKTYLPREAVGSVEYWRDLDGIDMSEGSWLLLTRNGYLLPKLVAFAQDSGVNYTVKGEPGINAKHLKAIKLWEHRRKGNDLTLREIQFLDDFATTKDHKIIWHDALGNITSEKREYYIALLRRGESLDNPRVHINTIHGTKGGEADNVILMLDCSYTTWEAANMLPDGEHRVWYVAVTRARENLHIIMQSGRYGYTL